MRGLTIIVLVLATSAPAFGDKRCESADARKWVFDGKTDYDLGRFHEAIERWEKAYAVCPSPGLLFNLAQAHRMVGDNEQAITLYRSWLREEPDADAQTRKEVEARISELAALIAAQRTTAEKPPTGVSGEATTDRPTTGTPPTGTETSEVPPHALAVTPAPRADGPVPVEIPDERQEARPWYRDWMGWSLVAGGVAVAGLGGGLFLYGGSLHDDAEGTFDRAEAEELNQSANSYRLVGGSMFVAGLAVASAGVVKLVLTDSPRTGGRATSVAFGAGWIAITGRF